MCQCLVDRMMTVPGAKWAQPKQTRTGQGIGASSVAVARKASERVRRPRRRRLTSEAPRSRRLDARRHCGISWAWRKPGKLNAKSRRQGLHIARVMSVVIVTINGIWINAV